MATKFTKDGGMLLSFESKEASFSHSLGVLIQLDNQNQVDALRTRSIILYPDLPTVIGRASKRASSFDHIARADNAFIKSPVVSRTHAELELRRSLDVCSPTLVL